MPNESLNIYFTIKDGASVTLATIADKTKALDKETQQLEQSYQALQKANADLIHRQTELKKELSLARDEAKEAKKTFAELGDTVSQDAYEKAQAKVEGLKNEITATNKALRENEKIFKSNVETVRKSAAGDTGGFSMLAKGLIGSQTGQMLSASLGGLAEATLTSAIGTPAASLLSDTFSNAISGAAAGAMFGVPGMLIGGGVGAISGLISGGTQIFEAQDDAFKDYYGGLHDAAQEATEERVSSGSTIAGSREQTRMAFARRLGGEAEADAFLDQVQAMAGSTNYNYDEITGYAKSLINSYAPEEIFGVLQSLSDATAGLDLSGGDVSMMIAGLSRMRTTGKATQEYLNYFSERGVDVYDALGRALGVDKSQVAEIITDGGVSGETAAQAILDYIDQTFGGLSEDLMGTYDAMTDNLEDIMSNIQAAGGEGYNEERKKGLAAEQEAYDGLLGEAMSTLSRIEGENRAYLENLSEQYKREALSAVLLGEDTTLFGGEQQAALAEMRDAYLQASEEYASGNQEAGLRMESLAEQAEALAEAAYASSDQYQALRETELDQIAAIRENTAALNGWRGDYTEQQERSKGLGGNIVEKTLIATNSFLGGEAFQSALAAGDEDEMARQLRDYGRTANSHAAGLDRVPYDEYPALLHEGERVLTAGEARAQDQGAGAGGVVITGNHFEVREDADIDKIAQALYEKLLLARMSG